MSGLDVGKNGFEANSSLVLSMCSNILPGVVQHHRYFFKSYPDLKQNESIIIDMVNLEIGVLVWLERGRRALKTLIQEA